ncbi:Mobile element protein, partial [hydrothermal vent metagenome]
MLREIERGLKFATTLASCLFDERDRARTIHSQAAMIRARIFAIACGYEDCADIDELRHDPAFKMACERLPDSGPALASQPTLSRLENAPSWRGLARMGLSLIDMFCDSFRSVPGHIVLDIDDTTDRTHGGQQLSLFNTHAGGYCFQPIHIYDAATGKPVCFVLRSGKRPSGEEAAQVLRHVIRRIRRNWPRIKITVRGGGHYGTPEVMDLLEHFGCFYILGLPGNSRLKELSYPWCEDAATRRALGKKDKVRRFFQA